MVNFLTKDFIKEQREGLINFLLLLLTIILVFLASYHTINSYLEIKLLRKKQQSIADRNQQLKEKLSQIEKLKKENSNIEEKINEQKQMLAQMTSGQEIFTDLSTIALTKLQVEKFEINKENFNFNGVVPDMKYLNLLNKKLEKSKLFKEFYLAEINKEVDFVIFTIKGQLQKGE